MSDIKFGRVTSSWNSWRSNDTWKVNTKRASHHAVTLNKTIIKLQSFWHWISAKVRSKINPSRRVLWWGINVYWNVGYFSKVCRTISIMLEKCLATLSNWPSHNRMTSFYGVSYRLKSYNIILKNPTKYSSSNLVYEYMNINGVCGNKL